MDPKRFASISCLFVLCQNFTLLKENEDLTEYRLHKKQPAGNRAKKCMHGKTKSSYYHHHESPSRRVPAAARLRDLDSCVRLFLSQHFFFYLTISFQFQTTNKGFSKTQQRQLFRQELKFEDVRIRVCCRAKCTRPHKALGMCHKHYKTVAVKARNFSS